MTLRAALVTLQRSLILGVMLLAQTAALATVPKFAKPSNQPPCHEMAMETAEAAKPTSPCCDPDSPCDVGHCGLACAHLGAPMLMLPNATVGEFVLAATVYRLQGRADLPLRRLIPPLPPPIAA